MKLTPLQKARLKNIERKHDWQLRRTGYLPRATYAYNKQKKQKNQWWDEVVLLALFTVVCVILLSV